MVTPSAPAILAALLFATTALTPGDVVGASRPHSSTFDESASPAPAAAPTTRHTMVRQRTAAGAVPEFKVEAVRRSPPPASPPPESPPPPAPCLQCAPSPATP